ncbi:hypothetical protein B0H13DRAFT_1999567 [Mycena leptocephala]|nr:hypothetical protein B0H13DRAFT_1999567 [Mycena leptocephala]
MTPNDEKKLKKAKVFLKHLERVDTSQGPVNKVILRFRLNREVELVFNAFVRIYGCTMTTRIISREEQDAVDPRQKNCAQYTSVLVTPEAQAAFLSQKSGRGREILAKYVPSTSRWAQPNISAHGVEGSHTTAAHPKNLSAEIDEKTVDIPSSKYEALSTRLSDVVGLLPTTDPLQGKRCRSELLDIAHELRWFRPPMIRKRPFDGRLRKMTRHAV